MAGVRTLSLAIVAALAAAVLSQVLRQPLVFDMVAASPGLQVMRSEVTRAQWRQCVAAAACSFMPKAGLGAIDDSYPVTGINALDAEEFVAWARRASGLEVRLPTLAEWQAFSEVTPEKPKEIFTDPRLAWAATYGSGARLDPKLRKPGGFGKNSKGIADVKGNVWEWTSTCVMAASGHCPAYFAMGEHEAKVTLFVRDPATGGCATGRPPAHLGLRLVLSSPR